MRIVSGNGARLFRPNAPITRAEAAKILVKAYEGGRFAPGPAAMQFGDGDRIPPALSGYVARAVELA